VNWQALDAAILLPALLAGLLVLATHVPLGRQVLARGIIFIDLAVAQIAGLGVIAAHTLGLHPEGLAVQAAAFGAALLGAGLLYLGERRWPQLQEALIGSVFVLAASAAVLLLAGDPRGGEHLQELLAGQVLWVTRADLLPVALLSALVLAAWFGLGARRSSLAFYGLFAVAVTASVQLVGVYLVFASLILPALGSRGYARGAGLAVGYGIGVGGYGLGLAGSALFDLPAGPAITWALALCALVGALLTRRRARPLV
jgi:zinc/manganese transport system permease protein